MPAAGGKLSYQETCHGTLARRSEQPHAPLPLFAHPHRIRDSLRKWEFYN
jgi:hypothetical protein